MSRVEKVYCLIIFAVSLLSGCVFFAMSIGHKQMHDAMVYIQYAQDMVSGGLWECGMGKEPGYSVLLAPLFMVFSGSGAIIAARFLNIILFAGSSVMFYLTLNVLMPTFSLKKSFLFSLLFALSPQLASFSALRVYSEPLQLILNSAVIYCFVRISVNNKDPWRRGEFRFWITAGLAMGWLIFTKSFFLLYPFWMVLFIFVHRVFFNKMRVSLKAAAKPVIVFLCISLLLPLMWSAKNYKRYGAFMVAGRGNEVLLSHTYLVDWGLKDSFKWSVYQLSDKLGRFYFPGDCERMAKVTGEPYAKARIYAKSGKPALDEWLRLIKDHPFKYVLFYALNGLNHVLFEGIYPHIFWFSEGPFVRCLYPISAVVLHFLYSIFIWLIIIAAMTKYALKTGFDFLKKLDLKYAVVVYSLAYFVFFAYHLHTEIRYLHPFYINMYLIFVLSCCYLRKRQV